MLQRRLVHATLVLALMFSGCAARQDYSSILASPNRPDDERALDSTRKPHEVLAFYGVKRGHRVADLWAGRGYYTAILSEIVGPEGLVYSANPAPRPELAERWRKPAFGNVKPLDGPLDRVALPQDASLDFVIIHLNYHDLAPAARMSMNKRVLGAVKRGGVYGVIDHSAKDDTGNEAAKTLHRIDKALVIEEVTSAGFKLAKEGTMLRRADDTRDFSVTKERGRSDRFVLAFEKP